MRVAVIGAGMAGLSAAARLVESGHAVDIYERSSQPGGRAGRLAEAGFSIDIGPTVLTMPHLLRETFAAFGRDLDDYLVLERVDPIYRSVFADGSVIHVRQGRGAMADEIRRTAGATDAANFEGFADWLTELYRTEFRPFIDTNYDSKVDLVRRLRALAKLGRLGAFGKLSTKIDSYFDDQRLRRLFSFQSLYAGVAPHEALALFGIITYMDAIEGVYAPRGGIHEIPVALASALADAGVEFHYDTPVSRILRSGTGQVNGLELAGETRVIADAVVCNADLPVAYRTLLGGVEAPRLARRGRYSPSCMLWVAGVRGEVSSATARHNIHFGAPWKSGFKAVIDDGVRMDDPSMLITVQSHGDDRVAPAGHTALSALEPVPNLDGAIDWAAEGEVHFGELRQRVADLGYPVDVVVERSFDPLDWEQLGHERGTPFSLSHTFRQSGPFRPTNVDEHVPGLVFAGASTVPGVGLPMVLISGKLAAQRVDDFARTTSVVRW